MLCVHVCACYVPCIQSVTSPTSSEHTLEQQSPRFLPAKQSCTLLSGDGGLAAQEEAPALPLDMVWPPLMLAVWIWASHVASPTIFSSAAWR